MLVEESIFDFNGPLYQGEEFYMKAVPCERRHVKQGLRITENHMLYLTNYRMVFTGRVNQVFPMEIFIRDIIKTTKKQLNPTTVLFKIDLRFTQQISKDQRKEVAYILKFDKLEDLYKLEEYLGYLMKTEDKSEITLKKQILVSDKVLYSVYQNLVLNSKMITQEQFWERHKYILENRLDQQLQYTKFQNQEKPRLVSLKTDPNAKYQPNTNELQYEGYSLQKEIESLSLNIKINEVNEATKKSIIKEIEDMYLRESSAYQSLRVTAPQDLANQGIIVHPLKKTMQIQEAKDSSPNIICPPVKIPMMEDIKFKITKDDVVNLIQSSDAGIKYRKRMDNQKEDNREKQKQEKQRDLTKKVVEYVGVFYMMMKRRASHEKHNYDKIGDMEKQIQTLKQEVEKNYSLDKGKELLAFINKALNNYMLHRKNEFFT